MSIAIIAILGTLGTLSIGFGWILIYFRIHRVDEKKRKEERKTTFTPPDWHGTDNDK